MESRSTLLTWLVLWLGAMVVVILSHWRSRRPSVGLVFAYLVDLWLIHWPAASLYALPWQHLGHDWTVTAGFRQSGYAVLAFALGSLFFAPLISGRAVAPSRGSPVLSDARLPAIYLLCGLVAHVLLLTVFGNVPSVTSLVSTGQFLLLAGLCLVCWNAWNAGNRKRLWGCVLGALLVIPLATTITQGFMGYGVSAVLVVCAFVASFYRPRWKVVLVGLVLTYAGLVLYDGYMRNRSAIRAVVWGGADYTGRIAALTAMLRSLKPLDLHDPVTLQLIDDRLNQNYLVGAAVSYIGITQGYARGATVEQAVLALIPRALWRDKPIKAGSGSIVSDYTGIRFAEGISVGVGQVMEFYINFGTLGVVLGFLLIGTVVTVVDWNAGSRLTRGDGQGFVRWFLPGICLLNVGGSLVEVTSSIAASVVVVWLVNHLLLASLPTSRVRTAGEPEGRRAARRAAGAVG